MLRHRPIAAVLALVFVAPAVPRAGLPSTPVELWRWEGQVDGPDRPWPTNVIAVPLVDRDLDGDTDAADGLDIVLSRLGDWDRWNQTLTALDGRTGELLWEVSDPRISSGYFEDLAVPLAAADIDGDGLIEILAHVSQEFGEEPAPSKLRVFDHDGTFVSETPWPGLTNYPGTNLALADLDQDGTVEALLTGNAISVGGGAITWTHSESMAGNVRDDATFTHAADILPDTPGLEVIYGANLFSANGLWLWGDFFSRMGGTAPDDFDGDGDAEIALIDGPNLYLYDHEGNEIQGPLSLAGWTPGSGRPSAPMTADIDGDALPELVVAMNEELVAVGWNGTELAIEWAIPIHDPSGLTGATAFDFDDDGASEIVYQDQVSWFVIDGRDGTILHDEWFPNRTGRGAPLVVGLGEECQAMIVVFAFGDIASDDRDAVDSVAAYVVDGSASPAGIWNQRTYHVTNVTPDGQVPRVETPPWQQGLGWHEQSGELGEGPGVTFESASVADPDDCNLGLVVTWEPATPDDPTADVVYDVHRSEADPPTCADALASPPIATGLTDLRHVDATTQPGVTYRYAVRARVATSACAIPSDACTEPLVETGEPRPDGVYATLFVSHVGQEITAHWRDARPLIGAEHFHLLKATLDPTAPFTNVTPEDSLAREHVETDTSAWLQFFDLRVANGCEVLSVDEFPPSY